MLNHSTIHLWGQAEKLLVGLTVINSKVVGSVHDNIYLPPLPLSMKIMGLVSGMRLRRPRLSWRDKFVTCARENRTPGSLKPHWFEASTHHQARSCTLLSFSSYKMDTGLLRVEVIIQKRSKAETHPSEGIARYNRIDSTSLVWFRLARIMV